MWWLEPSVRIVPRIIEEKLKIAVSERAAGWVEVEDLNNSSLNRRRLMLCGVEFEDVVSVAVFGCLDLFEKIFVAEQSKVAPHCSPYCSNH